MFQVRMVRFLLQAVVGGLAISMSSGQGYSDVLFVGATPEKALFVLKGRTYFTEELCNSRQMYAGSIDNEDENQILSNFIKETLGDSVWIAATDYAEEGVYRGIRTAMPLEFSNWEDSVPQEDLERNCLIMNAQGNLQPEYCNGALSNSTYHHHPLCEVPLYGFKFDNVAKKADIKVKKSSLGLRQSQPIAVLPQKTYYAAETTEGQYFHSALDYCHKQGLRLPHPSNDMEAQFLKNHAFNRQSRFLTSVTNTITPGCGSGLSTYRDFYTGEVFSEQGDHSGLRAMVMMVDPTGYSYTSYISGGSDYVVCEAVEENVIDYPCGIVGLHPRDTVRNDIPLNINEPEGLEFWKALLFNVNTTGVISHPHNKYVSAYRAGTNYWFQTNAETQNFISAEGTNTMLRSTRFYCLGDNFVQYNFALAVQDD